MLVTRGIYEKIYRVSDIHTMMEDIMIYVLQSKGRIIRTGQTVLT